MSNRNTRFPLNMLLIILEQMMTATKNRDDTTSVEINCHVSYSFPWWDIFHFNGEVVPQRPTLIHNILFLHEFKVKLVYDIKLNYVYLNLNFLFYLILAHFIFLNLHNL